MFYFYVVLLYRSMTDELTKAEPGRVSTNRRQRREWSDTLRLLLFFDGDPKRLRIDRFFSEWDEMRDLLPPELGQVGISLRTGELTLHGEAREYISRKLAEARREAA
jgi:hypothetical protein